MKKSPRTLQLSRETLSTLTVEKDQIVGGLLLAGNSRQPQLPATSDSVRVCCA